MSEREERERQIWVVCDLDEGMLYTVDGALNPREACNAAAKSWGLEVDDPTDSMRLWVFRRSDGMAFRPVQNWVEA